MILRPSGPGKVGTAGPFLVFAQLFKPQGDEKLATKTNPEPYSLSNIFFSFLS